MPTHLPSSLMSVAFPSSCPPMRFSQLSRTPEDILREGVRLQYLARIVREADAEYRILSIQRVPISRDRAGGGIDIALLDARVAVHPDAESAVGRGDLAPRRVAASARQPAGREPAAPAPARRRRRGCHAGSLKLTIPRAENTA